MNLWRRLRRGEKRTCVLALVLTLMGVFLMTVRVLGMRFSGILLLGIAALLLLCMASIFALGFFFTAIAPTERICQLLCYIAYFLMLFLSGASFPQEMLPEAVRKVTRQPADRFGLRTKGRIEPGADADLCLFDPSALRERDSYEHPETLATGMDYVLVGGRPAIAEARFTF